MQSKKTSAAAEPSSGTDRKAGNRGRPSPGTTVEPGVQYRGDGQYRVQIRERGQAFTRTFETLGEARAWKADTERRILGDHKVDVTLPERTTLEEAVQWAFTHGLGKKPKEICKQHERNLLSHWRWWGEQSYFSQWKLSSIRDVDLIAWVGEWQDYCDTYALQNVRKKESKNKDVGAEDQPLERPVKSQTITHRLNALSRLLNDWRLAHNLAASLLPNPVREGVRPPKDPGRNRRLKDGEEKMLLEGAQKSSRPWLVHAIIIAIETGIRQSELAELTWDRVKTMDKYPYIHIDKTKNGEERDVPLSLRAINAFHALRELADQHNFQNGFQSADQAQTNLPSIAADDLPPDAASKWTKPLPIYSARAIIHAFSDLLADHRKSNPDALNDLHWHDFRHEAISRLFENTDLRDNEIQAISGHLTPAMLSRYTHLRTRKLGPRLDRNSESKSNPLPGTLVLVPGKEAMVTSISNEAIPLSQADHFTRDYSRKMLLDALESIRERDPLGQPIVKRH